MDLTITIPDTKYDEFKTGFLKQNPKPEGAVISDEDFIRGWLQDQLFNNYQTGKILIARETTKPTIDVKIYEE